MSKCRRNQEAISLMVARLCPESDQRRVNEHLQQCPDCRAYFQELTEVVAAIARQKRQAAQAVPSAELRSRWTNQILNNATVAEPKPSTRKRAAFSARTWFSIRHPWLVWGLSTAAWVLLAFFIGYRHGRTDRPDPLENIKMVQETLAMFPHRVQAIVEDERGVNLILSDSDNVPVSAPLYIHVCDGKHCSSFLTFSGQEITVAGQKVTVLEDIHGGVILAGRQFVWSNTERTEMGNHWQIEAKNLGSKVM